MRKTSIKVQDDLLNRINRYKYKWQLKSHDAVIRRLFEICSKIENAKSSHKNPGTTNSFSSGLKTTNSESGAVHNKEETGK